ncbi:16S rRNA (guanine(527)-N(7))-methyltransferase RsmG [bacterium]|nr:MAG: 16S rRNA (guanine(527)-N(7))-methyltransferase RsmG [bacterium]
MSGQVQKIVPEDFLDERQREQLSEYANLLVEWNKKFNLTAILEQQSIMQDHFQDSLSLGCIVDLHHTKGLVDVGSGGGFPGLPLKIAFPDLRVVLVEVNEKKCLFLEAVIKALNLKHVELCAYDWRSFLRNTSYPIDLVCARASLQPSELIRMFKTSTPYYQATLFLLGLMSLEG